MASPEYLKARRADLSSFLVHLTRQYRGQSPRQNLVDMLTQKRIRARNYHCLFQGKLEGLPDEAGKSYRAVCFTETPLAAINYLTLEMRGRAKQFKPYGLVFRKSTVIGAGGNPVFYLATASEMGRKRQAALWKCFNVACKSTSHPYASFLPLVNKVDVNNDFTFEREWRVIGDFQFPHKEVFLGLAPEKDIPEMEGRFPRFPWISPRWGQDQVIEKLRGSHKMRQR